MPRRRANPPLKREPITQHATVTAAIIVGGFVLAAWALSPDAPIRENLNTVLSLLNVVFGPVIALLGSATGFYFGANTARRAAEDRAAGGGG